jgi:predicted nucleic acid-binding protein
MALICDTGGVYALYDADDQHHTSIKAIIESEPGPLILPLVLLAEIDYLLTARLGAAAAMDFLESVELGAFVLTGLSQQDLARCRELIIQYRDLQLGIADASVAIAAER